MKNIIAKFVAACAAIAFAALPIRAADWNDAYGMGNLADDWLFTGSGVPLAVIPSVQSNSVYYITSAGASGAPQIDQLLIRQDSIAGTLGWYQATNTWYCASNQPAGTNIIWLNSTNSGMATNDLLVLENNTLDSYQLLVLGGGSTTSTGEVITNAIGYVGIKVWNTPTNGITAGDKIHKMRLIQTITPLANGIFTNQINAVTSDHFGQWLKFGTKETPFLLRGRIGKPGMIVMTHSNSAALLVTGQYFVRPRR